MSATIPSNMLLSDLLKSTGYECPSDLMGKTFDEATTGDSEKQEKQVSITQNGETEVVADSGKVLSKVTVNVDVPNPTNVTLYAWGSENQVIYVKDKPSAYAENVPCYKATSGGLVATTCTFQKNYDRVIVDGVTYNAYHAHDITL